MQINELYFGYTPYTKYVNEEEISLPKFKEAISKPENNFIKDITDFLSKYDEKYNKALFVIKSKGSNFAKEVKKMCDKYAEEFDKTYSK